MIEGLTIIMAYYNQPDMLAEWFRVFGNYGALLSKISLRIVDDGSQEHPLQLPKDLGPFKSVRTFRILEDDGWNEMVARNIAMKHSDGWVFMTDPDYLLSPPEAGKLMGRPLRRGNVYHLRARLRSKLNPLPGTGNMRVIHTDDFWQVGGYDEDFAGAYGFSDTLLFKCLSQTFGIHRFKDIWMDHYPMGGLIKDAASPAERDTKRNSPIFMKKLDLINKQGLKLYIQSVKQQLKGKLAWKETT